MKANIQTDEKKIVHLQTESVNLQNLTMDAETMAPIQEDDLFNKLDEIHAELRLEAAQRADRHKDKKSVVLFYKPLPQDVILEFPNASISVSPRISYEELMAAVQWSIDLIIAGRPFISEPIRRIIEGMAFIKYFTDIEVTEEDLLYQYDILMNSGAISGVQEVIEDDQIRWYRNSVNRTCDSIMNYQNSVMGIVETLAAQAQQEDSGLNKILATVSQNQEVFEKLTPFIQAYQDLGEGKPLPEGTEVRDGKEVEEDEVII